MTTAEQTVSTTHRITLGRSGLEVSPICYGSWQLSPRFWGDQNHETLTHAMQRAFELGINFYDTADAYGDGLAEQVMGDALKDLPRDQLVVATKVYWHFYEDGRRHPDLSRDYIIEACEASLKRLNMDYIDLYQCHAFDPLAHPQEIVEALTRLQRQGKIRCYGTSNWNPEQLRMAAAHGARFDTEQPPYSLINRGIENELLPYCVANDIGVLVFSPLHKGLLTGKYTGKETFDDFRGNQADFQGERFATICERVKQVGEIAERYNLSTVQLVLATTLMHPGIHCAITGIKRVSDIEEAAGAMGKTLSREDYFEVRTLLTV
ncbi:MAG: aldo/keto reductase [Phycisphaeraceae bacterium]